MIPFMVLSDAPSTTTGLARITRELLRRMRTDPETSKVFRIATLGCGQRQFRTKPYPQYPTTIHCGEGELMDAWRDFSCGQHGVLMTIWNPSWLAWLAQMENRPFRLWGYFPIDCEGPAGILPAVQRSIIDCYDRKLAYSAWAAALIESQYLPHGIDTSIYYPRPLEIINGYIDGPVKVPEDHLKIGICATNSARKDWGLAAEVCSILKEREHKIAVIAHTNTLVADWDIPELFNEFGILENSIIDTDQFSEVQMAEWYSCCDVTLGIGSGEGFGYPIAESLACGVPCIHGNYAGGAEIADHVIEPIGYRYDGQTSDKRPIFNAATWANAVERAKTRTAELPEHLDWNNLWPKWKQWLLEGVK